MTYVPKDSTGEVDGVVRNTGEHETGNEGSRSRERKTTDLRSARFHKRNVPVVRTGSEVGLPGVRDVSKDDEEEPDLTAELGPELILPGSSPLCEEHEWTEISDTTAFCFKCNLHAMRGEDESGSFTTFQRRDTKVNDQGELISMYSPAHVVQTHKREDQGDWWPAGDYAKLQQTNLKLAEIQGMGGFAREFLQDVDTEQIFQEARQDASASNHGLPASAIPDGKARDLCRTDGVDKEVRRRLQRKDIKRRTPWR